MYPNTQNWYGMCYLHTTKTNVPKHTQNWYGMCYLHTTNTNVPKHTQNWYGMCYLHRTNIFLPTLFYLFYLFILYCLKKNEMRVKTGHIQQIKKNYGSLFFCKASFIFNWKHFNTLWVFFSFFYLYINKVELFISHSWLQGETW
jgi:hypothetical protein